MMLVFYSLTWVYLSLKYWGTVHIEMTLVIRTSIIWHLDYPNTKFHKPHNSQKPCGSWRLWYLAKCCFPIVKVTQSAENVLIIEEKLGICKLMTTDRSYTERYGSRRSTTVAKILKENVQHGHGKKLLEDRCAAKARWALYFWFGLATEWESHACYQANVEVGFCSILTVENFFKASIIII